MAISRYTPAVLAGLRGPIGPAQFAASLGLQLVLSLSGAALAAGVLVGAGVQPPTVFEPMRIDVAGVIVLGTTVISQVPSTLVGCLALSARLHDLGLSAWWMTGVLAPALVGAGLALLLPDGAGEVPTMLGGGTTLALTLLTAFWPGRGNKTVSAGDTAHPAA